MATATILTTNDRDSNGWPSLMMLPISQRQSERGGEHVMSYHPVVEVTEERAASVEMDKCAHKVKCVRACMRESLLYVFTYHIGP